MNPDEYAAQQAAISAATAHYVLQFGQFFRNPALTVVQWFGLLQLLFPEISRLRTEAATLARGFYDSQRETNHPNLPRNDRLLEDYKFEWFAENMDPVREVMSQEGSPEHAMASFALRAAREVENAGRAQIIHAVENDPEPGIIRGWARVATGRETCAWCLMLVSRGPVYLGADRAGLDLLDDEATKMIAAGEDISSFMEQWHDGCDCKVVPVFVSEKNWFGKPEADRALELWNKAAREAIAQEGEGKVHPSGKDKGKPFTRNELTINALRRQLENGEIDPSEYAAVAA